MKRIMLGTIIMLTTPFIVICVLLFFEINIFYSIDFWCAYMAYIGTIILSCIAVYQNKKAQEVNERLAKENNLLQKISVQRLLPILEIKDINISNAFGINKECNFDINTILVAESVDSNNRDIQIKANIGSQRNDGRYLKTVCLKLENISENIIRQISVDRIEFPGFRICNENIANAVCYGNEKYKFISELLLPNKSIDVTIQIYFSDDRYKKFWEFHDETSVGEFEMCMYLTNTSISDVKYKEKIRIEKAVGFKEKIMYKIYEEDHQNA